MHEIGAKPKPRAKRGSAHVVSSVDDECVAVGHNRADHITSHRRRTMVSARGTMTTSRSVALPNDVADAVRACAAALHARLIRVRDLRRSERCCS
jgi:hypothetical protein